MRIVLAILWKDLLVEWRSRDRVLAMLIFSLLMVMVFWFALPEYRGKDWTRLLPGLLWTAYVFASLLGLNRSFAAELENDAVSGLALAPANRGFVFLGKALASILLIGVVELVTAFAFAIFFDVDVAPAAAGLALVVGLGTIGIASIGTLLSAMSVRTRFREVLLPILLLPALFPIIAAAVGATRAAILGIPLPSESIQMLVVVDGIYLIVGFLGFDYVLDE